MQWEFDKSVADRFMDEARSNIPDYERVIDLCVDIAKEKNIRSVIDVGAALGYTVDKFLKEGYEDVEGVDNSTAMINSDLNLAKGKILLSSTFPNHRNYDMVLANWTLHFISDKIKYITDIYNGLNHDGVFILSDKTKQTEEIESLYYKFKLDNGVPLEYIYQKKKMLEGYMIVKSVKWYMDILTAIGFKNVQIINAKLGFVTFYCEKKYD
jgi:SAM-dependent methyltransferase